MTRRNAAARPIGIALTMLCLPLCREAAADLDVRAVDPLVQIRNDTELEGVARRGTIRMVGPRNGTCSGQALAVGDDLEGLEATMGPLRSAGGETIPEAAVRVRYAAKKELKFRTKMGRFSGIGADMYTNEPFYDALLDRPPQGARIVPIWVTVSIPAEAGPGLYTGELTVDDARLPVELQVAAWRCPDPLDWVTHVGLLQSPDTLARHYGVPEWSEEHLGLIAQSLRYLRELGNKDLYVTALYRKQFGQDHSMIRFRGATPAELTADFSIVDKYLSLYARCVGEPHALVLYLWDPVIRRVKRLRRGQKRWRGMKVSWIDAGGRPGVMEIPLPGEEGSEKIWRPVVDGMRERLKKLGWSQDILMLGCTNDQRPSADELAFYDKIAPGIGWAIWTHGAGDPPPQGDRLVLRGTMRIDHYEHPYCPALPKSAEEGILGGWNLEFPRSTNPRKFIFQYSPLSQFRSFPEGATVGGKNGAGGFAHLGLDFWELEGARTLLLRYNPETWDNLYRGSPTSLLEPGPDGPIATARFEMLREGLQECEARIVLERALIENKVQGRLAQECRALLLARIKARYKDAGFNPSHGATPTRLGARLWGVPENWQELTAHLFNLAGAAGRPAPARPAVVELKSEGAAR